MSTRTLRWILHTTLCAGVAMALVGCDDDSSDDPGAGGQGGTGGAQEIDGGAGAGGEPMGGEGGVGGEPVGGAGGQAGGAGGAPMGGMMGGAGGGEPDPCVAACDEFVLCSLEVCPGYDAAGAAEIDGLCQMACAEQPSFSVIVDGSATCADIVSFGLQSLEDEGYAAACDGMAQPTFPECEVFAAGVVSCMETSCAAAGAHRALLEAGYTMFCNDAVNSGNVTAEDMANLVTTDPQCQGMFLAPYIQQQLEDDPENPEDGILTAFCANGGPLVEAEVCEAACGTLEACVDPQDSPLGDAERCAFFCGATSFVPDGAWACSAEAPVCEALGPCFAPPEIEACAALGPKVAACVTEVCPPMGAVEEGFGNVIGDGCNEAVANQSFTEEAVLAAVGSETCDDPLLQFYVTFLTEDDPASMEDGVLVPICADGLPVPPETCEAACAAVVPCLEGVDPENALLAPGMCTYFCATNDQPEPWTCAAAVEGEMCQEVFACFPQDG